MEVAAAVGLGDTMKCFVDHRGRAVRGLPGEEGHQSSSPFFGRFKRIHSPTQTHASPCSPFYRRGR